MLASVKNSICRRLMKARRITSLPNGSSAVLAVVLVLILMVVWYGIRHTLLNPLARVIAHIREIASGNLTTSLTVSGRNEIGELASTVDHMQRSLIETVTTGAGRFRCDLFRHQRNCQR